MEAAGLALAAVAAGPQGQRFKGMSGVSHWEKPPQQRTATVGAQSQPSSRASSRGGPPEVEPEIMSSETGSSELLFCYLLSLLTSVTECIA